MGKKNKDKKKGKGAEKTQVKTEKKLSNKLKKDLLALGEDDIETIVAEIEKNEKKRLEVNEYTVEAPSRRLNFSLLAHPDKEELILFGGEFFNGQKTFIYNDLFLYNIPNNSWTLVKAPAGPPPRCGHQMVVTSANKGQLWLFGGEFASPTQSQFYHYRDLWVYHIDAKKWEKIIAPNGPSARSGHRMVISRKKLFVFGGFHDNLRDYKYFNDIYCFNIDEYKWSKLEPTGTPPAPRSGCCMIALNDGRILIYGGYSKERLKKDVDKGRVFVDAFLLTPEKNDSTGTKFKWVQTKLGGIHFSPRCSMPITTTSNNLTAYCYGGVFDVEDDEESIAGTFYNDLISLDLEKLQWKNVYLTGKKTAKYKSRRNKKDEIAHVEEKDSDNMQIIETEENTSQPQQQTTISDDGIFKVTVGRPTTSSTVVPTTHDNDEQSYVICETKFFQPSPRMNCGLAVKHGVLYLYGGMFEDGDKQITFNDFYCLDLKKLNEWKTIIPDDVSKLEWLESDDSENEREESDDNEKEEEEASIEEKFDSSDDNC